MGGIALAWALGQGVIVYRWWKLGAFPTPGVFFASTALFCGIGAVAQYQPARQLATVCAFGLDLAILLQVVGKAPSGVTGWPPPLINNPNVVLPPGGSSINTTAATSGGSTGSTGITGVQAL